MELDKTNFVSENFVIRMAEVYLNLAEALVMTDKEGEAREVLKLSLIHIYLILMINFLRLNY